MVHQFLSQERELLHDLVTPSQVGTHLPLVRVPIMPLEITTQPFQMLLCMQNGMQLPTQLPTTEIQVMVELRQPQVGTQLGKLHLIQF